MANETLRPDGRPLELTDLNVTLFSTTLSARVETFPGSAPGTRSGGPGLTGPVMRSADVRELGTVVLQDEHPRRDQEKSVSLFLPAGGPEDGRLLLYIDENGAVTIHLPTEEQRPPPGVRAGRAGMLRFDVPIRRPIQEGPAPVRGIGGMVAKKLFKIIGWKVAGIAARRVGPPLVRGWESHNRPLRVLGWPELFQAGAAPLGGSIPAGERSLLFIHGTFSRVASAFADLAGDTKFLDAFQARYSDRIYGFDHPTLAAGVTTNVMQLYDHLAPGVHNFDIICHSRGGLVARALRDFGEDQLKARFGVDSRRGQYEPALVEWGEAWDINDNVEVRVNRIFFAATPNNGTALAQPTHLKKYLDVLMTATNLLPDFVDITVDAILMAAKLLLSDVMPVLPGLDDQRPGSGIVQQLKQIPGLNDAAVTANYEPPPGLQTVLRTTDAAADFIFGGEQNDLVVPTVGVSNWPDGGFSAERCLTLEREQAVHHCNLFQQGDVRQRLLAWIAD